MTDKTYLARPGQSLTEHLDCVAANAETLVPQSAQTAYGDSLQHLVRTVAHLHDIGKLTTAFQAYITEEADRQPEPSEYHAAVGALVTFHALAQQDFSPHAAVAGFIAVLRHHQALPDVEGVLHQWGTRAAPYSDLEPKLRDIDETATTAANTRVRTATEDVVGWDDIHIDDLLVYQRYFRQFEVEEGFYPLLQRVWATLNCADKLNAAGVDDHIPPGVDRPDPSSIQFENDATGVTADLNKHRTAAREGVSDRLLNMDTESTVYTLTLPTGFGKTFAGLEAALERAEKTGGRVIYALPYTTILDQVDEAIRDQFGVTPTGNAYTLHHHLAETRTELDDERVSDGSEMLYAESWQAWLVLTTFVQLFESLAGPANTQSIKLPVLQNSVLVIDEPQVLPQEWWRLVAQLIEVLVADYNATVILMTATQPRFLDESPLPLEPVELVPERDRYFEFLADNARVVYEIDESVPGLAGGGEPLVPARAAERLVTDTVGPAGATLAITNTVRNAAELRQATLATADDQSLSVLELGNIVDDFVRANGDRIVSRLQGKTDVSPLTNEIISAVDDRLVDGDYDLLVVTLTAALRPSDRTLLIETLRALLETQMPSGRPPLLVLSTQLIEAGVDLSFDRVYRDYAPLPALVQAAGRCNRSFESDRGRVILWRLSSPSNGTLPSSQIYTQGVDRLVPTRVAIETVAGDADEIQEIEMITDGVDEYYATLHGDDHRGHEQDRLVRMYHRAEADTLHAESLIDSHTADVLVLRSSADQRLLSQYLEHKTNNAFQEGQSDLATLQQLFASIPADEVEGTDESGAILSELGYPADMIDEFGIVDSRRNTTYDLTGATGLRNII